MFGSLKNALGLDTLKVQTLLNQSTVMVGTSLKGTVSIDGVAHDKTINHVDLHLQTLAENEGHNDRLQTHTLGSVRLSGRLIVPAHDRVVLPFELSLSDQTPISAINCPHNQIRLWLHTDVDVASTLDSTDKDHISTTPTPVMARFLQAMTQAGFRLVKTDVELGRLNTPYGSSDFGCYQELEYYGGGLGINSVEVSFLPKNGLTHVVLEIDRAFRSDSYRVISLNEQMDTPQMVHLIQQNLGLW